MNRIYNFSLFLESASGEVEKEVGKIISEMFAKKSNVKFSGKQDGGPEFVEFEVNETDFKLNYAGENLSLDYSEGVLKKREYHVSLKYVTKYKEGTENSPIYKIKFKINLKPTSEVEFKKEDVAWSFDKKPKEVIRFLKDEEKTYKWDDESKTLSMSKSVFNNMEGNENLRSLISHAGGVRVRAK